jgi:uncharacterized cupin superfamily protein
MKLPDPKPLWTAAEIAGTPETRIRHPWNPNSEIHVRPLSQAAGLSRVVLSLARVPPGKESFVHHSHERDEVFEVGPGDFMGFTAPGVGHHLINPYEEDLVYLMGGERSGLDVGYFPKFKRRIIFSRSGICAVDEAALQTMTFDQWLAGEDASPAATTGDDATGRSDPSPGEPETRPSHAGS